MESSPQKTTQRRPLVSLSTRAIGAFGLRPGMHLVIPGFRPFIVWTRRWHLNAEPRPCSRSQGKGLAVGISSPRISAALHPARPNGYYFHSRTPLIRPLKNLDSDRIRPPATVYRKIPVLTPHLAVYGLHLKTSLNSHGLQIIFAHIVRPP